jgi:hypothetical protein
LPVICARAAAGLALWEGVANSDSGLADPLSALRAARASTYRSLVRARALALARLGRRVEAIEPLTELIDKRPRDEEVLAELLRWRPRRRQRARHEVHRGFIAVHRGSSRFIAVHGAELVENPAFAFRWSSGASGAAGDGRGWLRRWGGCPVDETGGGLDCPDPFLDHSYHLGDPGRVANACAHHVAG